MDNKQFDPMKIGRFRFGVVAPLLSRPASDGDLASEIRELMRRKWRHPVSEEPWSISTRTIERWYYKAKENPADPVSALAPLGRRCNAIGSGMSAAQKEFLREQYEQHKNWTVKLHVDNLCAKSRACPEIGGVPSYSTVKRWMRSVAMYRRKKWRHAMTAGQAKAQVRVEAREIRSFEATHVGGLWHTDFHGSERRFATPSGEMKAAKLIAFLDDYSRLILHAQWYWDEDTEASTHALMQAIQKRGLPQKLMSDNGSPFIAAEFVEGLSRLGVEHDPTLVHSPYQNGKQECFWGHIEGRCLAMLDGVPDVTLRLLNEATQAWVEREYNLKVHGETNVVPMTRFLDGPTVMRPSPSGEHLRDVFRMDVTRRQRQSDGTISLEAKRFEVPDRFRHFKDLTVRYARWDLGHVDLVDPRSGKAIAPIYPQDKAANASGLRRPRDGACPQELSAEAILMPNAIPPLLAELMAEYAATGLPPAYIPCCKEMES